jgi:penicillin amidase
MTSTPEPVARRKGPLIAKIVGALLVIFVVLPAVFLYVMLSGSKAQLEGSLEAPGLGSSVAITRDRLGIPTIRATTRADLAYATGFVHAQDRFFQMDLSRRLAAGELSEMFGAVAVEQDRKVRLFRFRGVARQVLAQTPADQRAVIEAYTRGVNAGLSSLRARPWEYIALQLTPAPWRQEDVVLVSLAMWWDLQANSLLRDKLRVAINMHLGGPECANGWKCALEFFYPHGTSWDSPNSASGALSPVSQIRLPTPEELDLRDPTRRSPAPLAPDSRASQPPAVIGGRLRIESLDSLAFLSMPTVPDKQSAVGSNGWVVGGTLTEGGGSLVASDMHLGLRVPAIWYRARLQLAPPHGGELTLDLNGVTLPGAPVLVAGSNSHIAWGFTNSYGDWADLEFVPCTAEDSTSLHTTTGETIPLTTATEKIRVKGQKVEVILPVPTGPDGILVESHPNQRQCWFARWLATVPAATNFDIMKLENAASVAQAVELAPNLGIPHQNMMVGDRDGHVAWTIAGRIPDTSDPKQRLTGTAPWTTAENHPRVIDPPSGRVWTANARSVDDAAAEAQIGGDEAGMGSEYDLGARAKQIHDDLVAIRAPAKPADMLAVQIDDRALFLTHWHDLLLKLLTDEAVTGFPQRAEFKKLVAGWNARATPDSVGYRLVRAYRTQVEGMVWSMLLDGLDVDAPDAQPPAQFEGPLWELLTQQPPHLLASRFPDWRAFLLQQVDDTIESLTNAGCGSLATCTWGTGHAVSVRHPMSGGLPLFARFLNMPVMAIPGDHDMPRVQDGSFGASERFAVVPGREAEGYLHIAGGQSGHPLSPYYSAGFKEWAEGKPLPFLPGPAEHTLTLGPASHD